MPLELLQTPRPARGFCFVAGQPSAAFNHILEGILGDGGDTGSSDLLALGKARVLGCALPRQNISAGAVTNVLVSPVRRLDLLQQLPGPPHGPRPDAAGQEKPVPPRNRFLVNARRLGELLVEQRATVGLNRGAAGIGTSAVPQENRTPTLADIGVDKKLSSHAQRVAAIRRYTRPVLHRGGLFRCRLSLFPRCSPAKKKGLAVSS